MTRKFLRKVFPKVDGEQVNVYHTRLNKAERYIKIVLLKGLLVAIVVAIFLSIAPSLNHSGHHGHYEEHPLYGKDYTVTTPYRWVWDCCNGNHIEE